MKLVYTNTVDQIAEFNLYTFVRSPHFRRNILNGRMFVLIYVILIIIYAYYKLEFIDRLIVMGAFVVIGILWYFLFPPFYTHSIKDEVYSKQRHGRLDLFDMSVEFVNGSLNVIRSIGDEIKSRTIILDNDISAIVPVADALYIITVDEEQSLVIPFSVFKSEDERQEFVSALNEAFPAKFSQARKFYDRSH